MMRYLTLATGSDAEHAEPVFVTDDPDVIAATVEAMLAKLGPLPAARSAPGDRGQRPPNDDLPA